MTASGLKKIKFGVDNEKYRCYTSPHQAKALWVEPEAPFFVADSHRLLHAEKEKEAIMEEVLSELYGVWFLIGAALYSGCRQVSQWVRPVSPEPRMQVTFL